jgi:methionyl-tRNA formyltransferase
MKQKEFRIVFMGTPEFAVHILDELYKQAYNIVGVVTAPDKPAGRGQILHHSAVKQYALQKHTPILQPVSLKDPEFIDELKNLHADLFVVVAFRMLPEIVWSMPLKGTINLHASLLPQYRGAAPINWAIMNGETETGVTTFFIEKEIDTGNIIKQSRILIGHNETVGELYIRLMELGATVMNSTVHKIMEGNANGVPQQELINGEEKAAPKLFKNDCEIGWNNPVQHVHNFIRGLSPIPGAWCFLLNQKTGEKKSFKFFKSEISDQKIQDNCSLLESKEGILVPCSDFYLKILELQVEGKKRMSFSDFLAGNQIQDWKIIRE